MDNLLFCDLDGVLADFDEAFARLAGSMPQTEIELKKWDMIAAADHLFRHMPMKRDAALLWRYIQPYNPIILTGLPTSTPHAEEDKRQWVAERFGHTEVICCKSRDKCLHIRAVGDILIDDRDEYRENWERAGGIWIQHSSAYDSICQLRDLGL